MPMTEGSNAPTARTAESTPARAHCCARLAEAASGGYSAIDRRLAELDQEWDIGRVIQLQAAATLLGGMMLAVRHPRTWTLIPAFVAGVLVQNTLEDNSPLDFLLRRMGFRRARDVAAERYALKALRGDFHTIQPWPHGSRANNVERALQSAEM